jgi:hypothetical protein
VSPFGEKGLDMIKALLVGVVLFLVATFPATWLLMLFLGNVHANVSYWGALPLGILVSVLIGATSARSYDV